MPESLIQVRDLYKNYKKLEAVKGVSFEIPKGQIFGLIGPDGAGKTSIIQCLAGVLSADRGEVSIAGINCLKKRCPTKGEKPKVCNLRVIGCDAYAHIPKDERGKFDISCRVW